MEVPVYQARHPEKVRAVQDRIRLVGTGIPVHDIQDASIPDGDGLPASDSHIRGEIAAICEKQITVKIGRH